ncbi:toprim domain-containing protein [Vibrio sp. Y2-5]|uniref:toprim domain-containing protein n=1 Tax=Vibrio sp. Y2-5 TaxID=2743977 RepID=UPI0016606477|nr:toprim domain-containing protein [Vibrio sp. Y2-5]MBD0786699.1 toprim domain-containing protein [Vibrio sp. Y2-5]
MASAERLKQQIDLHDLAHRLHMERPDSNGNYRAPNRDDKHPSVSIFNAAEAGYMMWKDHASGEKGSCIDLVIYCGQADDASEAMKWLHEEYGIPTDDVAQPNKPQSQLAWVADKQLAVAGDARGYLIDQRGIPAEVVDMLQKRGAFGYSDWTSPSKSPGDLGYGGPAITFPSRCMFTNEVMGIDFRFFDPSMNGDNKTKAMGEKRGFPYIPDKMALKRAHTVVVVESAINAISAIAAYDPKGKGKAMVTAIATRGLAVNEIDWRFLTGKRVVCCFDNDMPIEDGPRKGHRPGPEAAWIVHEKCTALNIPCFLVDQAGAKWEGINDLNDYLRKHDTLFTKYALEYFEPWLVTGQEGEFENTKFKRLPLPHHDQTLYWMYRVKPDFTSVLKIVTNEEGEQKIPQDVCSFRIAGLSKVTISSVNSAMTGEPDLQPKTIYSASIQTPDSPRELTRFVMKREQLYNIDVWRRVGGGIFNPGKFSRMISILERSTHIGARNAVNFVGLAWQDGKAILNEGPDCYFPEPQQMCPYHNLQFPAGTPDHGRRVIEAYHATFSDNAALMLLVWSLGAHIKTFLGFWPHYMLQSGKGSGKSTLIKSLERTIGFTMFSGQNMKSDWRLVTSISHTSHPVGWEEISAQKQQVIDAAVVLLQESYQYTISKRGTDLTEFLCIAPVLLAGEDVPVQSLIGKLVRSDLTGRKGEMIPDDMPRFPIKNWILYLTTYSRPQMKQIYRECVEYLSKHCMAKPDDNGAQRMRDNYACLMLAWRLLCEFCGVAGNYGHFVRDLAKEMNFHIRETEAEREPWVWIMELILGEMDAGHFRHPYAFDWVEGELCLLVRTSHIMQHISQSPALKNKFDSLPVKSDRILKKQLKEAKVVIKDGYEKSINGKRVANFVALGVENLREFGLFPTIPDDVREKDNNQ